MIYNGRYVPDYLRITGIQSDRGPLTNKQKCSKKILKEIQDRADKQVKKQGRKCVYTTKTGS